MTTTLRKPTTSSHFSVPPKAPIQCGHPFLLATEGRDDRTRPQTSSLAVPPPPPRHPSTHFTPLAPRTDNASDEPPSPPPSRPPRAGPRPRVTRALAPAASADVPQARLLPDGRAVAPPSAPPAVKAMIEAANRIRHRPYHWGGGHRRWNASGYDCSGSVSYVMHAAGLLTGAPLDSTGCAGAAAGRAAGSASTPATSTSSRSSPGCAGTPPTAKTATGPAPAGAKRPGRPAASGSATRSACWAPCRSLLDRARHPWRRAARSSQPGATADTATGQRLYGGTTRSFKRRR